MDLFERINQQQQSNYNTQSQLVSPEIMQNIQRTSVPQFQVDLTPSEQAIVTQRMSMSDNPDEEKEKWEQAILMARQYNVPLEYAIDNLDSMVKYQTGVKPQYNQSFTRSLKNSFDIGSLTVSRGTLAEEYYWAAKNGDDTAEIEKQIEELDGKIAEMYDYTPRKWYQNILKGAAQTIAYTADIAAVSSGFAALGNIAAPGLGTALSTAASFAEGYRLTKYSAYYDMVKAGVNPDVADWTSTLSGGIQAAIESVLGIEAGLGRIAAGGSANFVTRLMKNMYLNGTFNTIGLMATRYLTNVASEGIEEFLQEITDKVFTNIAYTQSEMDAPFTVGDTMKAAVDSFVQGAGAALVLGAVGTVAETVNDVRYAKAMRQDALTTSSKQVFIEKHMEDEQLETIGNQKRREALAQTYDNINAQYEEAIEGLSTAEARTVDVDTIEQPENVNMEDEEGNIVEPKTSKDLPELKRMDNGRLRVQEATNVVQMSDGSERHQLLVGSNDGTSNRYGTVTYTLNEDGTVEINNVKTRAGYQSITADAIQELARRYPGQTITWDPETETQQKIKQSILDNSPNGQLNYYESNTDVQERTQLAEKIGKAFTNLNRDERNVAAVLTQLRAQAKGMTANEYMDKYISGMESGDLEKGKLGRTIIKGAKAVITAGQSANFSTFAHESFHVIRNEMSEEENRRLADAFKEAVNTDSFKKFVAASRKVLQMDYNTIKSQIEAMDGKNWNEAQEEIAARMFESYLLNGKTTNTKLADLFSKIAEFFRKIYGLLRGQRMLNDNIIKAYDSLFEKSAEAQTVNENVSEGETVLNQTQTEAEQEYAEVKAKYKGTDQWMKAPNGNPTNLTERQWVQVRTPSFKKWFGDWENDPTSVSKYSLDRNGEPRLFYHGSLTEGIEVFTPQYGYTARRVFGERRHSTTVSFTTEKDVAESYARTTSEIDDILKVWGSRVGDIIFGNLDMMNEESEKNQAFIEALQKSDNFSWMDSVEQLPDFSDTFYMSKDPNDEEYQYYKDWIKDWTEEAPRVLEEKYPDIAKQLRDSRELLKGIENAGTEDRIANVYEVFLRIPTNVESMDSTPETIGIDLDRNYGFLEVDELPGKTFVADLGLSGTNGDHLVVYTNESNNIKSATDNIGTFSNENPNIFYQQVEDQELIDKFESEKKVTAYRAMQIIDGKLYPPMAAVVEGSLVPNAEIGKWYKSDERPEIAFTKTNKKGQVIIDKESGEPAYYFLLDKANGSNLAARYNPYWHSSRSPLNDQFSSAYKRPNLVTVEVEIPISDINSKYKADLAKNAVGEVDWHSGPVSGQLAELGRPRKVFLSQYNKIIRVIPDSEVAEAIREQLGDSGIAIPSNTVTPSLRAELEKLGVPIEGKVLNQTDFSSYDSEYFNAINDNDLEKAQNIINEVANLKGYSPDSVYQGTSAFNGKAPSSNAYYDTREERRQAYEEESFEGDASLGDYKEGIDPMNLGLFLTNPNMVRTDYAEESVANLKRGLQNGKIVMYRSVPSNVKEGSFRNGDWVTPSREYAEINADIHEWGDDYRIIEQEVPIDDIWWDGNDINEWGFDDGNGYVYQNTENNRKLFDTITRDENGNIIPPSQRFNENNPSVFYQTEDEDEALMSDAKDMDLDDFLDFGEFMYDDYTEAQLRQIWNRAHGKTTDGQKQTGPAITEDMTDEQKDEEFIRYFESDEALRSLIEKLRSAYSLRRDVNNRGIGAETEEEYNEIMRDLETFDRFMREASPFFKNIISGTGTVSDTSLKNIRTTMENAPRMYRDLYAEITGDDSLRADVYDKYLPNIDEPGFEELKGMSIADRKKLSEKIENKTLKEKLLSGKETLNGEAEKVIKSMDDEIAKLEDDLKQMQAKNNEYYNAFNADEKRIVQLNEQLADAKHQLDDYNRKIRLKMDKGNRISPKAITARNTIQEKIDLLNEQLKTLRATDRTKAAEQRRQAIADLKKEIREKQNARREAKKVHDYKLKLASAITREVSNAVDYEYRQKIMAIQALVDPNFRQNTIWFDGKRYTVDEFRNYFRSLFDGVSEEELNEEILKDYEAFGLTKKQADRLVQKNLNDFTVSELEEMAQQVADLADEGRQVWQAKQDEKRRQARRLQNQIISGIMSRPHAKTPDEMPTPGSAEDKKAQKNVRKQLRTAWFKTLNMDRKAQMLDNDEKGVAYDLLIRERRKVQSNESKAKNARINPVMDLMKQLNVNPQDLYQTVDIVLNGKTEKFTYSDLFYGLAAQRDERNYRAFAYGTLVTIGEKEQLNHDNNLIEALGFAKNKQFVQQAEAALAQKPDYVKVFQAMENDLQSHSAAMAEFSIREYNDVPSFQDYYLPIYRADFNGTKLAAQLSEDVQRQNPGKNASLPSMSRWKERIDISANNQRPVHLDYFSTWLETVEEVEHTIATLGYERDLKRVFQNFGSETLKSYIDANFGRGMLKDIDNYINEVGNPPVYNDVQGTEKTIRSLRGNLYSAYLGFKASGIVLQAITSPAPTLGYVNPFSLAKNLLKMTFQFRKTWDFVSGMSEFMKNRSMDPALDIVKKEANNYTDPKLKRAYANFLEKGTMGLEVIDKWAVTASWMALYEKKLNEFEFQNDADSMRKAAEYADEIIAETQPLADPAELAPLFKGRSEWAKAFMQFTTSMNVIWNNVTYDIIGQARKKGTFRRSVGMLFGYALAGAILGAVQNGTGDDDEPEDKVRQFLYNMTTQFTGSVPVFGTALDQLAEGVITGEASQFYGTNSIFPGIEDTLKGLTKLGESFSEEDEDKRKKKLETALKNMTKGVGLLAGVPTSALNELKKTFVDEEGFTFNPAALAGRREK